VVFFTLYGITTVYIMCVSDCLFRKIFLFGNGALMLGLIGFDFSSMAIELSGRPWDLEDLRPINLDLMISE